MELRRIKETAKRLGYNVSTFLRAAPLLCGAGAGLDEASQVFLNAKLLRNLEQIRAHIEIDGTASADVLRVLTSTCNGIEESLARIPKTRAGKSKRKRSTGRAA